MIAQLAVRGTREPSSLCDKSYLAGLSLPAQRTRMLGAFLRTYLRLKPDKEDRMEFVTEWEIKGQWRVLLRQ